MQHKEVVLYLALMGLVSLVEYWLGKTKKIRANSMIELSVFLAVGCVALLIQGMKKCQSKSLK